VAHTKARRHEGKGKAESSGILKKIRGRFAMARLKASESRFGFRYGGGMAGGFLFYSRASSVV
jgi:hypothetical protein